MVEAVLGMVLLGVALSIYLWTKEYDERIARLEKRDLERTEAETARQRMSPAEKNLEDVLRAGEAKQEEAEMRLQEATEELREAKTTDRGRWAAAEAKRESMARNSEARERVWRTGEGAE